MSACLAPRTKTSPPVASAAAAQLAASIRSGIGRWRVAAQPRHALDLDHPVGVHLDDRAHLLQDADQVDDLRLDRGVAQLGDALGQHGGEQHLLGGADARVRQLELGAVQAVRRGQVQALRRLVDDRAELAQRLQVEVDRPVADVAAAEVGDERVAEPVQQRAAEQDRDPAGPACTLISSTCGPFDVGRVEAPARRRLVARDPNAVQLQQAADHLDVADVGHVVQPARRLPSSAATIALETRFFARATRTSPWSGVPPCT